VGSKTHDDDERRFIIETLSDFDVLGFINYHPEVAEADRLGKSVIEASTDAVNEAAKIVERLEEIVVRRQGG